MKVLLSILSGFLITLSAFAGGAIYAVSLLAVKTAPAPILDMNASSAWSSEAINVAAASNEDAGTGGGKEPGSTERIMMEADFSDRPLEKVDATLTAAVPNQNTELVEISVRSQQHQAWCASRCRSYDADSDSYRTYRGAARPCLSPYSSGYQDSYPEGGDVSDEAFIEDAAYVEVSTAHDHVQSCAARYRSYRARDNTYQPLSGGQRRECR